MKSIRHIRTIFHLQIYVMPGYNMQYISLKIIDRVSLNQKTENIYYSSLKANINIPLKILLNGVVSCSL